MGSRKPGFIKRLALLIVVVVIVAGIAVAGVEITCSPWFCNRCHEMNIYYDTWRICNHSPRGDCMQCHARPGFINFLKAKVNGFFSLFYHFLGSTHVEATLPVVCLKEGCHVLEEIDARSDERDIDSTVKLNHKEHVELYNKIGTRYECIPCHKDVAHGRNKKYMPDMKEICFVCHSDSDIRYKNCAICHPEHPPIEGDVEEIYSIHKETGVGCEECHIDAHKANEIACNSCHEESYSKLTTFRIKGAKEQP